MRPADLEGLPPQVAEMARIAWDTYEKTGDQKVLYAYLWSTMVLSMKMIFNLVRRLDALEHRPDGDLH